MTDRTPEQALTDVLGALVRNQETTDLLSDLVRDCAALMPAGAVAVLVHNGHRQLELLSATSHRATELELYQAQENHGPCVDAARSGEPVSAVGEATSSRTGTRSGRRSWTPGSWPCTPSL